MDETVSTVVPVSITPKNVYGLRNEVDGNIQFSFNDEVIYPVESVLVFHDFKTNKQRFLRFPENTVPSVISINPSRRLLAVVEITTFKEKTTNISIYDTGTLKKRRNFQLPSDAKDKEIYKIIFVHDSRAVVALTKTPNEILYMMFFDKTGTIVESVIGLPNQRVTATCIAGNPQDTGMVAVCGDGILKLMSKSETGFTSSATIKAHFAVKSMAWLSMETLLLGLNKNKLALIENGEVKSQFNAAELDLIDLSKDPETENEDGVDHQATTTTVGAESNEPVICMIALSRCLAYVIGDKVYFFEKVSKYQYQRVAIIRLYKYIYSEKFYQIKNLAINAQQDTVIVTAGHSQIYECNVKENKSGEVTTLMKFTPLGELIHIDEIVDISVCSWRTIIMTASKDQTIRVWNYETEKVELVKRYQVDITVTELNATGQFAAIGFSDQLRIMQIFMDDLNIIKTYNFPRCSQVKYSYFGHLMAAAYESFISISSVYNLDVIRTLKGHNGNVLSLAWSRDDKYLISGGAEGAIYQWDVETGQRIQEIVQKGTEYRALCCSSDPLSIFAVTDSGFLRELNNSEIIRELHTPKKEPFLSLALARSDLIMFASSDSGHLYNVQLPFLDAGGGTFTNYRFFDSAVTRIVFSYDGTLLVTASKKGTLVIWILQNIDGKVAPLDQDLLKGQEVIIPRDMLKEKNDQITNLELRILQQAAEFQYQESQNEIFDSQQLADVHKGYCQALEALKTRNNELEQKHTEDLNEITFRINDLKAEHRKQIQNLSDQFTERMLMEYQKYQCFSKSSNEIQDDYEEKLRKSAGLLQDTVEALEVDFKKQLEQREELIRDLMQELQDVKFEFNEYCRQVEVENEKNTMDTVIKYENTLKAEQDEEILWRGKAGVLKKKSDTVAKEAKRLLEEVELLNDEHTKSQRLIGKLMREKEDLRKDVQDREFAISVKEKRIQEILHKNQELEKYKQVLSHKITELKMQIEPRECQINEKRKQITEKELQLDSLNKENVQLEGQLMNLEEKHRQTVADLKEQRNISKSSRELFYALCSEIYNVAGKINNPDELREGIKGLFEKYASDESLKKHIILETQVRAEFDRQRAHLEGSIVEYKRKLQDKSQSKGSVDLLKENMNLLNEIEELRKEAGKNNKELGNLMNALKLTDRKNSQTQHRLTKTLEDVESYRLENEDEIQTLISQFDELKLKNEELKRELKEIDKNVEFEKMY
ncbi:cilia- and flagella-associated protein 57-like [Episyrphus balteatus]|uniref:cilia- and flagella-associated protein 57-like n=1 Tax=Episyrphus balteatus TaxID=286459 RepID=UPI002486A77B|nr:cilia- and flagella-associated protein 57-like [Episyrphus balteatus]